MNSLRGGMSFAVLNDRYPLTFTYSIRGKVHGVVIIKNICVGLQRNTVKPSIMHTIRQPNYNGRTVCLLPITL